MMKNQKRRVLLLGLGDLGSRIAQIVAERGLANALKLASRGHPPVIWRRDCGEPRAARCLEKKLMVWIRLASQDSWPISSRI